VVNSANDQINPNIVPDGTGGAIAVWQDSTFGNWDIRSQRLSSTGVQLWNASGVDVGTALANQTSPKNVSDGMGGSIYAFQDKRSGDFDIYAFRIDANGVAVGINQLATSTKTMTAFPNPSTGELTFDVPLSSSASRLKIFNELGIEVFSTFLPSQKTVLNTDLPAGLYHFTIKNDDALFNGTFIIAK